MTGFAGIASKVCRVFIITVKSLSCLYLRRNHPHHMFRLTSKLEHVGSDGEDVLEVQFLGASTLPRTRIWLANMGIVLRATKYDSYFSIRNSL
jgi:hypothetical protein